MNIISIDEIKKSSHNYWNIFNLQYDEIYRMQLPHLLKYEDKNSMRNSIETRLPFLDVNLLKTSISLNHDFKLKDGWTKYILRKIADNILPTNIVWRKNKLGFEAPVKSWIDCIQNDMENMIEKSAIINVLINEKINFKDIDAKQKWKLFNVAKWEEIYNVEIN